MFGCPLPRNSQRTRTGGARTLRERDGGTCSSSRSRSVRASPVRVPCEFEAQEQLRTIKNDRLLTPTKKIRTQRYGVPSSFSGRSPPDCSASKLAAQVCAGPSPPSTPPSPAHAERRRRLTQRAAARISRGDPLRGHFSFEERKAPGGNDKENDGGKGSPKVTQGVIGGDRGRWGVHEGPLGPSWGVKDTTGRSPVVYSLREVKGKNVRSTFVRTLSVTS